MSDNVKLFGLTKTLIRLQSGQSVRFANEEALQQWLSKFCTVNILISLREYEADLNLHWAHMTEDTFLNYTADMNLPMYLHYIKMFTETECKDLLNVLIHSLKSDP